MGNRCEEICGRERDGTGNMGNRRWTLQGLSERKAGNLKEVGLGGLSESRFDSKLSTLSGEKDTESRNSWV